MGVGIRFLICVSACFAAIPLSFAEDARFFDNRPVDESVLEFFYTRTHSSTSSDDRLPLVGINAKFDTLTLNYRHYVDWGTQAGFWAVQVPSVELKAADDNDPFGETRETGVGDPTLLFVGNFYGRPSVDASSFENWSERPALGWSAGVTVPVGEYDPNATVNAGNNRWVVHAQLHATQPLRFGRFNAGLGVHYFGDNDEFWGAWQLQQRPIAQLDANLSHDIGNGIWWWWGVQGHYGGRTTANHVPCEKARLYDVVCNDGELIDNMPFSPMQNDWRASIGVHLEIAGSIMDLVLQRIINDSGEHDVEIGKFAYSTRW